MIKWWTSTNKVKVMPQWIFKKTIIWSLLKHLKILQILQKKLFSSTSITWESMCLRNRMIRDNKKINKINSFLKSKIKRNNRLWIGAQIHTFVKIRICFKDFKKIEPLKFRRVFSLRIQINKRLISLSVKIL